MCSTKFVLFFSGFLILTSNCCSGLTADGVPEHKHLAAHHARSRGYFAMPKTIEEMEDYLACSKYPECDLVVSNEKIWCDVEMDICGELEAVLWDRYLPSIDEYLKRFDEFMQWASMDKYAEMVASLFQKSEGSDVELAHHLWGCICDVHRECRKVSLKLIFRAVKGLETSLRRWPAYGGSLMRAYDHLIASPEVGPGSATYKKISEEVEKMLTGGIVVEMK